MKQIMRERPNRKALFSGIAYGDYTHKMLLQGLRQILGVLLGDICPRFCHYIDGKRIFVRRLHRGTHTDESVAREFMQKTFGYLTARGIAGREKKLLWFVS